MPTYQTEYNPLLNRNIHYPLIKFPERKKSHIDKIIEYQLWKSPNAIRDFKQYLNKVGLDYGLLSKYYSSIVNKYNIPNKLSNERGVNRMKSIEKYIKLNFPVSCYLDIGCLDGGITETIGRYFRLNKFQIHGVDIKSYKNAGESGYDNIIFSLYNGTKLPYSDNSFDLITCLMTFHHIPEENSVALTKEIYRVLKPGGIMILREHDSHTDDDKKLLNLMHDFYDYVWNDTVTHEHESHGIGEEKWHNCFRSSVQWDNQFISNGFNIHTPANIYKGYKNPFMSYICSYQKNINNDNYKKLFRILPNDMKREVYYRRTNEIKNVMHWGQRKLLLSEIEFLTLYFTNNNTIGKDVYVIYAGSAPGTHILYLSKLFPTVYFELYDPREFSDKLKNSRMIKTHIQYFTDETAKMWDTDEHPDKVILFISDIRTGDTETMNANEVENRVKIDNQWQMDWYNIIKPKLSMFKFRLPYNSDEKTEYLSGDIYLQAYAPATSTETRLIVGQNAKLKIYDNREFEEQLFYFNKKERAISYENILNKISRNEKNGISNNYDGASEVHILEKYLAYSTQLNRHTIIKKIIEMIKIISDELSHTRNLFSEQPIKERKKQLLIKLQSDGYIPSHIKLTQNTFNIYVIPRYEYFKQLGYLEEK